jgi:hypothetical protein
MTSEGKRYGRGKAQAAAMDAIRAAGNAGIAYHDLAATVGTSYASVLQAATRLRQLGLVVRDGGMMGRTPGILYAAEFAPPPKPARAKRAALIAKLQKGLNHRPVSMDAGADTIVPATVRVVVGPANRDHRFSVHRLPDGYVSQINPDECREWARGAR